MYVYTKRNGRWTQTAALHGKATHGADGAGFGSSVATSPSGKTIVVARSHQKFVDVFTKRSGSWVESRRLSTGDWNGSIAASNSTIYVGSPPNGKRVLVLRKRAGHWKQVTFFTGAGVRRGDNFGGAMSVSGGTCLIGASDRNGFRGAAYVFSH